MRLTPVLIIVVLLTAGLGTGYRQVAKRVKLAESLPTPSPTATPAFDPGHELTAEEAVDFLLGSTDADCDGIPNRVDNCPITYNPSQKDSDKDGIGDACDGGSTSTYRADLRCDMDGDGIVDQDDNCPATCNPDQRDENQNGVGDVCEGKRKDEIPLSPCRKRRVVKPPKKQIYNATK